MVTFEDVKNNPDIRAYISKADESLIALGYTEHSFAHVTKVAEAAAEILHTLGYSNHEIELVKIAGYLHDIGNIVNRIDHAQSGAVMAFRLLKIFLTRMLLCRKAAEALGVEFSLVINGQRMM